MLAYVFKKYPKNFAFQPFIILQQFSREIAVFLKSSLLWIVSIAFCL